MPQSTWDLSPLLSSDTDSTITTLQQEIETANHSFINKWKNRTDFLENPEILLQALTEYEHLQRHFGTSGKLGYYFSLRQAQDQENPEVKAGYNSIHEFSTNIYNQIQFFELTLAKLSEENLAQLLQFDELKPYRHFLERLLATGPHLLTEPEEHIMNLTSLPAHSNWVHLTSQLLGQEEAPVLHEDGEQKIVPLITILSLLQSQQKPVRDEAATAINTILAKHSTVAEAEINSVFGHKKVSDELRKFARPDSSRHLSDDMEAATIDTLTETVSSRFDIAHRYYRLKAQLIGQKQLAYHERSFPLGTIQKKYSYSEAQELVRHTFQKLHPQFAEIFDTFVAQNQIDVYPKKSKSGGAFCAHDLITQPTYILLNHTDTLQDVLTLAHELGHGINNELIKEKQHALYFGTSMATAEVASTFMEDFVLQELLAEADEELRLTILMMRLNDDISTIFRQVACYQFEQELHQEFRKTNYLSAAQIGVIFQKHMTAYMGEAVEQSPGSENWWIYWSHIRSFFYVYSYASGLLISKSLQASVKSDSTFIESVTSFLQAGLSESPARIFQHLGIDISDKRFWQNGLNEIDQALDQAEQLARKLGKI